MSAKELIDQVAALSERERTVFEQLYLTMGDPARSTTPKTAVAWPEFGDRLHAIYGDKVIPDSQPIIDEGRGDR